MIAILIVFILVILAYLLFRPKSETIYDKIYFDNNSTTQPHTDVVKAVANAAYLGNPSASYSFGARIEQDKLRSKVLKWCGVTEDTHLCLVTSGASESNNLIIRSIVDAAHKRNSKVSPHVIMSSIEHKTSIDCINQLVEDGRATVTFVAPNIYGQVNPADVEKAIQPSTVLITIMHANNELGTINDIKTIGTIANNNKIPFHTDVVQTFGKVPPEMNKMGINALSMSFHKMNGPMGIGCLVIDKTLASNIDAQISGSQNEHLRGGTENIPAIAGAAVAMDITHKKRIEKNLHLEEMKDMIMSELSDYFIFHKYSDYANKSDDDALNMVKTQVNNEKSKAIIVLGPTDDMGRPNDNLTLPNTILLSVVNMPGGSTGVGDSYQRFCNIKLKSDLAAMGVMISIGSACLTSAKGPSHVLKAINAPFIIRCGVVRISLGDYNTKAQVHEFCKKFKAAAWMQ